MKDKQLCCWGCGKDNIQWQVWACNECIEREE